MSDEFRSVAWLAASDAVLCDSRPLTVWITNSVTSVYADDHRTKDYTSRRRRHIFDAQTIKQEQNLEK